LDGFFVLTQLGVAVGSVVVGLNVVWRSILELVAVVIDGILELIHLAVDQTSVAVDDWVRWVKLNRSIEIKDRVFKPARVSSELVLTFQSYDGSRLGYASIQHWSYRA